MSLDKFTTEELSQEIARREAIGCKFKAKDLIVSKRNTPPYFNTISAYRVISTKNGYVRLICDDGKIRGVHQDQFYLPLDDEDFGGPDESFY